MLIMILLILIAINEVSLENLSQGVQLAWQGIWDSLGMINTENHIC